jgi:hypothetical protein
MNADALAYLAIERLQRAYADISTRHAWDEVVSIATPDALFTFDTHSDTFEIQGAAAYAEFSVKMTGRFSFYLYTPLNFVVTINDDGTAQGHTYSLEVAADANTGEWINFYGVYQDRYAIFEGTWRFARRHYRTFGRRIAGQLEAFPLEIDPR